MMGVVEFPPFGRRRLRRPHGLSKRGRQTKHDAPIVGIATVGFEMSPESSRPLRRIETRLSQQRPPQRSGFLVGVVDVRDQRLHGALVRTKQTNRVLVASCIRNILALPVAPAAQQHLLDEPHRESHVAPLLLLLLSSRKRHAAAASSPDNSRFVESPLRPFLETTSPGGIGNGVLLRIGVAKGGAARESTVHVVVVVVVLATGRLPRVRRRVVGAENAVEGCPERGWGRAEEFVGSMMVVGIFAGIGIVAMGMVEGVSLSQ
mmetsp:Transcript_10736/g.22333  ORF Transcript_10736/g.22333 Transcript_10736/m.22333 type:complete len:262 (+) Transcript_10736:768-1553(+)